MCSCCHRCDPCGSKFLTRKSLLDHKQNCVKARIAKGRSSLTNGRSSFQCDECFRSYTSMDSLRCHQSHKHPTTPRVPCSLCRNTFANQSRLNIHCHQYHLEHVRRATELMRAAAGAKDAKTVDQHPPQPLAVPNFPPPTQPPQNAGFSFAPPPGTVGFPNVAPQMIMSQTFATSAPFPGLWSIPTGYGTAIPNYTPTNFPTNNNIF